MSQYFNIRPIHIKKKKRRGGEEEDGDEASISHASSSTPGYQVDGKRAWSVVLGSFLAHLSVLGMLYAFGIFVIPLTQEFQATRAEVSLIGTVNTGLFYCGGIFSGPLADKFGTRPVMIFGTIIWTAGCFLASVTTAIWQQIVTQGVLVGIGTAFVYWPAISVVPQWFEKYRASAVGLAALGAGIGNLIFALGGNSIISALGWRNTLRVMGGVGCILLIISILLLQRRIPTINKGGLFGTAKTLIKLKSYRWFLFATFLFQWGFFIPAYSSDLGIDSTFQGLAIAMLGIGSSVGRVAIGPIADKVGRMSTFRACMFLAALTCALWSVCIEISTILVFAFFMDFFAGGFIAQSPVVAGDLWGVGSLGGTFALVNLAMIPGGLACGPIAGLIFQNYGTYLPAILGAAGFIFAASCALMFVKKEKSVTTATTSQQVNNDIPIDSLNSNTVLTPTNNPSFSHVIEEDDNNKGKLEEQAIV